MAKYEILITETLQRKVCIEATGHREALAIAWEMYSNEEIILTADDHEGTEIELSDDYD